MRSFSAHNLTAVLMSGRWSPAANQLQECRIHKAKCRENISIYIKKSLFILVVANRWRPKRPMCWSAGRNTVEADVQRLGSSNRVRELANDADF